MQDINRLILDITGGSRAAHAFIIEGRQGRNRDSFVRHLISGLECADPDPGARPCGSCPACRQVAAGTSLDVVHMNKSTGSSGAARPSYKVSDASEFIERLSMGSYGRYLIGVINDADQLSEVIQNKLLKTLEEPGEDTIILLAAANRDNLLNTVLSRCSIVRVDDHIGFSDDEIDVPPEEDEQVRDTEKLKSVAMMLAERQCSFHEFREHADRSVKSREDALCVIDLFEDQVVAMMSGNAAGDERFLNAGSASGLAMMAEAAARARMDIRRDMNHSKALKRLYLELR